MRCYAHTVQNDQEMQLSDLDAWDDAEKRRQALRSSHHAHRNMLHAEAKEISEQYSEENKKLTLKMNLEKVSKSEAVHQCVAVPMFILLPFPSNYDHA